MVCMPIIRAKKAVDDYLKTNQMACIAFAASCIKKAAYARTSLFSTSVSMHPSEDQVLEKGLAGSRPSWTTGFLCETTLLSGALLSLQRRREGLGICLEDAQAMFKQANYSSCQLGCSIQRDSFDYIYWILLSTGAVSQ